MKLSDEELTTDLEIEKKAILEMTQAKNNVNAAINNLSSALSLRCFAKNKKENEEDIDTLSTSLDSLIVIRDELTKTLKPYFAFHEMDECEVSEWLIDDEMPEEIKFGKKKGI